MVVENNLKATINFHKKQCLLVIKRNKKHLSNQVVSTTNALEKRSLAGCESFVLRWSKKVREYFGLYEIFCISKQEKNKYCVSEVNLFFYMRVVSLMYHSVNYHGK